MRRTIVIALLFAALGIWTTSRAFARRPSAPIQPIDFSHRAHIEADHLDCELCHSGSRRSAFAEIAPVERCMGCHRYVLTANPEIVKLRRAWDAAKTIDWVKVYRLPQFVRFNHAAHAIADVTCDTCHGDVGSMHRVFQTVDLTMGWCVRCHRDRHAPDDCLTCHY
jgi:Cytochrome c7 and related cytochrome c